MQARVSSSRLEGKVMRSILGKPMLARQIERVMKSRRIGTLTVATSTRSDDDAIESLCRELGVACFRGSLDDVLDRYYQAALTSRPDHVVRLTGDCPLADPAVIDQVIDAHLADANDYTSNVLPPTFPDGLDVEVFRFSCLDTAWREATLPSHREHVTQFFQKNPVRFKIGNVSHLPDLSYLRWTVDESGDFEFVTKVFERLYRSNPGLGMADVLGLLEQEPDLAKINAGIGRNEGLLKSLEADRAFSRKSGA